MSNRKRRGRRERAHMKYVAKRQEHEMLVAKRVRAERTRQHRGHLVLKVRKLVDAESIENKDPSKRTGFLRQLLGW